MIFYRLSIDNISETKSSNFHDDESSDDNDTYLFVNRNRMGGNFSDYESDDSESDCD